MFSFYQTDGYLYQHCSCERPGNFTDRSQNQYEPTVVNQCRHTSGMLYLILNLNRRYMWNHMAWFKAHTHKIFSCRLQKTNGRYSGFNSIIVKGSHDEEWHEWRLQCSQRHEQLQLSTLHLKPSLPIASPPAEGLKVRPCYL